ncbi:PAS domain-containing protein [Bacteroidota bacterium]
MSINEKDRLNIVLDNSPFPMAVVDTNDQNIIFWNKSAIQLFGHDPKTTEEWYELAYPNPEYRQEVIERWKPFLEIAQNSSRAINTGEYEICCIDGTVKISELYAQFIPGSLIVTVNDITERKHAEKQIKALNQQLQASEQQLKASNQQLLASEQQLKASNQQLEAGEKEFRLSSEAMPQILLAHIFIFTFK